MKKILFAIVIIGAFVALPISTFAATYLYVNTSGNVATVNADSPAQALMVSDLGAHSGVMLVTGNAPVLTGPITTNTTSVIGNVTANGVTYLYVDINGNIKTVVANSAAQALMVSDLGPHSGVMLVR